MKRTGKEVEYDERKIREALCKANRDVSKEDRVTGEEIDELLKGVVQGLNKVKVGVEEIQDYVEEELVNLGRYRLAKEYIIYRYNREKVRQDNTTDTSILDLVRNTNKDVMEENSNKNPFAASTQRDLIAGEVSKDLAFRRLLPKDIVDGHKEGVIHFHDADYYIQSIINCCLIDIGDMLDNGTMINKVMIESPNSFRVACNIMTQIIANVASNQYGGQSVNIKHLAPYVRKSYKTYLKEIQEEQKEYGIKDKKKAEELAWKRTKTEIESGIQTIQYQINTLMTTNGQSPFVTLFLHIEEGEYEKEVALIIEELLKQRIKGVKNKSGNYTTPTFPKLVYVLEEHNSFKGGKYDYITELCVECNTKRIYPDYISGKVMRELHNGEVFSCMGCRSFLSEWRDDTDTPVWEGRFNQGVVSLNLPQIALEASGDITVFWEELEKRLALCFKALMCRHKALLGTTSDVSEIHWQQGALARLAPGEVIDEYLKDGRSTLSLGYIGVYEMTYAMLGQSHTSKEGKEFAMKVMERLKEATESWKRQTGLGFGLYGTPAESLCYRFSEIDKKKYGEVENITDKGWYTNSYHVDVREEVGAFEKLEFESEFQNLSTGGAISYIEMPSMYANPEALKEMVKYIYETIMYAEFNTKSDSCLACGYDGEIATVDRGDGEYVWECPNCRNRDQKKMIVVRRTCGYLGQESWNVGKTKEIASRVLHLQNI